MPYIFLKQLIKYADSENPLDSAIFIMLLLVFSSNPLAYSRRCIFMYLLAVMPITLLNLRQK